MSPFVCVEKYQLADREIHMVGDHVGVCWNTLWETKRLVRPEDGLTYETKVPKRATPLSDPYISFVWVKGSGEDGFYESEDNPADGGFTKHFALKMVEELSRAVEYIEGLS